MRALIFGIPLFLALFSCRRVDEKVKEQDTAAKDTVVSSFDSLANAEVKADKLTPEVLWQFGRLGEFKLSPDGKTVIYTVSRYDVKENKGYREIFSIPAKGGQPKKLTGSPWSKYNLQWIKNGEKIAFLCNKTGYMQIYEMHPDSADMKQVSFISGGINSFKYSPDGKHVYYCKNVDMETTPQELHPDLRKADVKIYTELMYRHWDHWHEYAYSHVFIAPVVEGKVKPGRDIMEGERWDAPLSPFFDSREMTWSPDGKKIAYTCKKMYGKEYALSTNSDIYVYNLTDSTTVNVSEGNPGYDKYPCFSPDSRKIAWESMATPGYEADQVNLIVYDTETGEKTNYTPDFDQNAKHYVWSDDGTKIYFISGIKATYQVYVIDLSSKEIRQITKGRHDYMNAGTTGGVMIASKMTISLAPELFIVDIKTGEETQLTFINRNIYEKIRMGKVEERWVTTTDGKKMLVWIVYPPDFDANKKYPALLYCQGGPQSAVSQRWHYRWNLQAFAAGGYVIIAPNRRGLPTFGHEWNHQISGDYGGQNIKDYFSAIDNAAQEPFIDETRMGAVGASYGGYSVYYIAGHHEGRFKAFISHCGIFNEESMYASTEEMFFVNYDLKGPFWKRPKPKAYTEFSPHLYVQNWDTPIMISTGGYDFRIPYTENLQAFNCARLNGVEAKLLFFPYESHLILQPQNSILWYREFHKWLDKHL